MTTGFITFEFRRGWAFLTLHGDGEPSTLRASSIRDSFSELLDAFTALAKGGSSASALWLGEGTGCFIDLSTITGTDLTFAVHAVQEPLEPVGRGEPVLWRPVRGGLLHTGAVQRDRAWRDLSRELTRIRRIYASDGFMPEWGRPFPSAHLETFEQVATLLDESAALPGGWSG